MQFNDKLIEILGNFATINQSIVFEEGNVIRTMSPMKTIIATAKIENPITESFAVYELGAFLSQVTSMETPTIEVGDRIRSFTEKEQMFTPKCDPSLVVTPPDKPITLPSVDVEFTVDAETMKRVLKQAATSKSQQLAFTGDGNKLFIEGLDMKNLGGHAYRYEAGTTAKKFRMVFEFDNLKLLPRNYTIQVSSKGLSRFVADDIEYFVAVESSSTFE